MKNRAIERRLLIFVTIGLVLAFFSLHQNRKPQFAEIDANYAEKTSVNLDKNFEPQTLAKLLVEGNYVPDEKDAVFIADHIKGKLAEGKTLPNLGELNKRSFRIAADSINLRGGEYLKNRLAESQLRLGISDSLPAVAETAKNFGQGDRQIRVKIREENAKAGKFAKLQDKNFYAATNVLVQIKEHYYDSLSTAQDFILGYAMTDESGIAVFAGLNAESYYSVLPIRKGFEYGNSKGTTKGNLGSTKDKTFVFTQRPHQLSPFDAYAYAGIKEDSTVTVRTPQEFQSKLTTNLVWILIAWWALHFFLCIRKKKTDRLLLPLLMTLSGICLLVMYSIHNPLNDKMLGNDMAQGILIGIGLIALLSEINPVTFFNSNYRFLGKFGGVRPIHFDIIRTILIGISGIFGKKFQNRVSKLPEGGGYLILALTLTVLLFPFGTSPQADVKVNLFFFQPSEIAKYLIIIFLAAFFYHNAEKIQTFSQKFEKKAFRIQFRTIVWVVAGLGALLGMYLILRDMGPALVIALTFILIYSVVRGDLPQLIFGVFTFALFLLAANRLVPGSKSVMFAFAALWFVLWLIYGFAVYRKKQFFESAVFLNLVIAVFVFGSSLPNVGERLQERNDIYMGVWDNEVRGGDQVAQGLWGLASGGFSGQGLGEGNPNLVPAFHTDMIFTSVGEESGWLGLMLVILCMAILLYRSLLVGRRAGNPFAFYLTAGIAVITGVQFLIITLGSVGLIPLTGVAVPFLSYGKTSMIINMLAFGIVFSVSNIRATDNQKEQLKRYDLMIVTAKYGYAAFALVLLGTLFWYQVLAQKSTLIRPALMSNTQGARIVEYNPRIRLLLKELDAGNIYDRNGILLATNNKEQISNESDKYIKAGIAPDIYKNELKKRKGKRYYPFGEHLFFWLGDYNQPNILWNDSETNPRGYIAERRHLADLRGFDNLKYDKAGKIRQIDLIARKDKAAFLYPVEKQYKYTDYDYSALLPMLKAGLHSNEVKKWNDKREKRDITLTVDAALQTRMQNEIAAYAADNFKGANWNKLRISVVVLDAKTGDLLCSANYPLPNMTTLKEKQNENVYNEKDRREKAYADRDLGLTYQTPPGSTAKVMSALAGLQKSGTAAANKTYYIDERETVEPPTKEPNFQRDGHNTTMEEAIRLSSNNYFINLVNEQNLYRNLDSIYQTVGIRINTRDKEKFKILTPYFFTPYKNKDEKNAYLQAVMDAGRKNVHTYDDYVEKRSKNKVYEQMSGYRNGHDWNQLAWSWGQNDMGATPLNMARVASIVANDGNFVETQFVKKGNATLKVAKPNTVKIVSANEANILKGYMQNESAKHKKNGYANFMVGMGGKTGTPERELRYVKYNKNGEPIRNKNGEPVKYVQKLNDGWYIFFIDSPKEKATLAVAVRMERLGAGISDNAVKLTDKVVLRILRECEYLND